MLGNVMKHADDTFEELDRQIGGLKAETKSYRDTLRVSDRQRVRSLARAQFKKGRKR